MDRSVADRTETSAFLHKLNCTYLVHNLYQLCTWTRSCHSTFTSWNLGRRRLWDLRRHLTAQSGLYQQRVGFPVALQSPPLEQKLAHLCISIIWFRKYSTVLIQRKHPNYHSFVVLHYVIGLFHISDYLFGFRIRLTVVLYVSGASVGHIINPVLPYRSQDDGPTRCVCLKVIDWKVWLSQFGMFRFSAGEQFLRLCGIWD